MQLNRSLSKADRHRLIESVITRKRVGTQFELLDALADAGCIVTQATVSRDIRELGLEKTRDPLARPRYAMPHAARRTEPRELLTRALDELGHERIVGTLAGDDTCLVIAPSERDARALARELQTVTGS